MRVAGWTGAGLSESAQTALVVHALAQCSGSAVGKPVETADYYTKETQQTQHQIRVLPGLLVSRRFPARGFSPIPQSPHPTKIASHISEGAAARGVT